MPRVPMRTRSRARIDSLDGAPGGTTERMLDAGERLFAEQGFRATSIREIAAKASVNGAAVSYHFGGKNGLMRAVLKRRIQPLNERRLHELDEVEKRHADPTVEEILRAFIAPTMRLAFENPEFMRIMGRFSVEPDEDLRAYFLRECQELVRRYKAALGRALPDLHLREMFWRMHFLMGSMIHTWAAAEDLEVVSEGLCRAKDVPKLLTERLVAFGAAGLRARSL